MTDFKTSSFSGGTNCVEVAFERSSFCGSAACVEVHLAVDEVLVRDSKDADSPVLRFTTDEWTAFIRGAKAGQFDG